MRGQAYFDRLRYANERGQLVDNRLITSHTAIMMGKPVVGGTRITVELILEKLAGGETVEQILSAHPQLTEQGIRAALAFAAEALKADVVYPAEKIAGGYFTPTKASTGRLSKQSVALAKRSFP